jgi:hypothetical protein
MTHDPVCVLCYAPATLLDKEYDEYWCWTCAGEYDIDENDEFVVKVEGNKNEETTEAGTDT